MSFSGNTHTMTLCEREVLTWDTDYPGCVTFEEYVEAFKADEKMVSVKVEYAPVIFVLGCYWGGPYDIYCVDLKSQGLLQKKSRELKFTFVAESSNDFDIELRDLISYDKQDGFDDSFTILSPQIYTVTSKGLANE